MTTPTFLTMRQEILTRLSGVHRGIGMDAHDASRWEITEAGAIRIYWGDYNTQLRRSGSWVAENIHPLVQPFVDEEKGMPFRRALELMVEGLNPLLIAQNGIDDEILEALMTG
ncbi:hypothetical protein ACVXZ4_04245 [Lacisediminihabitans sp. FW035]